MGKPRVPPLPHYIFMRSRDDFNDIFVITHSGTPGALTLLVTNQNMPVTLERVLYGPYDGPYIENGRVRLFVDNGALDGEFVIPPSPIHNQQRVLSRRANERSFLELSAPASWKPGTQLTKTEISI